MAVLGNTKITNLTLLDGVIGNLNPVANNIHDLGTSSLKWRNIYGNLKGNAENVTGTVAVANGGTGATAFTANSVIISGNTTTAPLTTRGIRNNTSAGALGWTSSTTDITLVTTNTIAYWDGRYQTSNNNSNLEYCKLGKLGTAAIHAHGDYAPASHGNHVPATQTANNAIFLRNDNTWQTVTPANIGAAPSSTISCTTANVKTALGTGSGTTKFLREDGTWQTPAYIANAAYGNVSTSGTIGQSSGWTLANGDGLVVFDSSNSNKLERTGITFDASTATKCLTQKGTWESFMPGNVPVTNVAISADTTTNASYPLVFGTTSTTAAKTESLQKNSAKFYVNPSTGNIQATTFNGFTLAAASAKSVVTSIDTSASLPTSNAVKTFVEGKGYVTSSGVTSITLKAGAGITLDTDNTAITSTGTRTISITGINTSTGSESSCLTAKGTWKPFSPAIGSTSITTLGTITTGTWNGTEISGSYLGTMVGATSSTAGAKGVVPAPAAGDQGKVLNGAGNWVDKSPLFQYTTTATKIYLLGTTMIPRSGTQTTSTLYTPGDESAERMYMDSTTNTLVAPNATFGGSVTATSFSGSGAGLTNIPASAVASMTGATSSAAGAAGIIPAPAAGDQAAFLQGDATWYKLNVRNGTGTGSIVLGGVGEQGSNSLPTATADNAYAQGVWTTASGKHSHAEGYGTTASGNASHSEGSSTIASGWTSHAQGSGTIANHAYQHVFGEYNIGDTSTAAATERGNFIEIVGNGTASNSRSNARTLDWEGNEMLTGSLTTKSTVIDLSKANNNVSTTLWPSTFDIRDSANRIISRQEAVVESSGRIGGYWYVKNYDTSGNQVAQKGILMWLDKSGTMTYDISDPANFCSAIGAIPTYQELSSGVNLNTVRTSGFYRINTNLVNAPSDVEYGQLIVSKNSDTILQIVSSYHNPNAVYYRVGYAIGLSGETYSAWKKVLSSLDIYPVGSYFISEVSTSPASLFGGTWTQMTGFFPWATSSSPGSTGGEASHTLTTNEMPSHQHSRAINKSSVEASGYWGLWNSSSSGFYGRVIVETGTSLSGSAGGSAAHNNMPPYREVYMWKRVS